MPFLPRSADTVNQERGAAAAKQSEQSPRQSSLCTIGRVLDAAPLRLEFFSPTFLPKLIILILFTRFMIPSTATQCILIILSIL